MIELTRIQTIYQEGVPAFVVLPFSDFAREHPVEASLILPHEPRVPVGDAVPHEVVGKVIKEGQSYLRAWREYLGMTQAEVAQKVGISQSAYSQMEMEGKRLRRATLEKLATAMGLNIEQLR